MLPEAREKITCGGKRGEGREVTGQVQEDALSPCPLCLYSAGFCKKEIMPSRGIRPTKAVCAWQVLSPGDVSRTSQEPKEWA